MSPAGLRSLLFIAVLVHYWVSADCYANGKVTKSCSSMEPHHRVHGQTTPSPYRLTVNAMTYRPGDQIQVILSGNSYFEGFLLQARNAAVQGSASVVGTFTLTDPKRTQLLTCNKVKGSAVSHTSAAQKKEVIVIWTAPSSPVDQVQFFVTVVQSFLTFWVKVPGPIIYGNGFTPKPMTTPPSFHTTIPSILPGPFTSKGCGESKSCLLDPPDCNPEEDHFCFFLSMSAEGAKSVMFELSGPAEGYIAFALSRDTWMGNDDVYMCVKEGDGVSVSAATLHGRMEPEDESKSGLSSVSWRLADGAIQCRFSRLVRLANQESARFNLDGDYYLFLAYGGAQDGQLFQHSRQPLISSQSKLIAGPPEVLRGSRAPILMKMHGALMMLAWMLTGSVGTFIANFFQLDWQNRSLLGQKVWFQVHRGLMMLTVALTVTSFCLPLFYRRGWSKGAGVHPYLGCTVLALTLIQPIMAAVRPPPDSDRRFIFNWAHFGFGTAAEVLAVIAMFTGMRQSSLLLPQPWATHVLIGYVAWMVSFRALFMVQKQRYLKNSWNSLDKSESSHGSSRVKSLLLTVFALGNSGFLVALLSSVAKL